MKRGISLADDLAKRLEACLQAHPGLTFSALIRQALERELMPPDTRAILDLAGLVPEASTYARERAEDRFIQQER